MPRVSRWKAEVLLPGDIVSRRGAIKPDVEQFVERVAVGQPCRPLLLSAEEIGMVVEGQCDRKSDTRSNGLTTGKVGADALDRAAFVMHVVPTRTFSV